MYPTSLLSGFHIQFILSAFAYPLPLPAFPDAIKVKKTAMQGGSKLRDKDRRGRIYERDSQHGKAEVYTHST